MAGGGRSDLWLAALDEAKRRYDAAKTLYAGHGSPGPVSIIDEQTAYILAVRDMVRSSLKLHPEPSDETKAAIQERIRSTYKDYPLEAIIDMNTASLAGEATPQTRES